MLFFVTSHCFTFVPIVPFSKNWSLMVTTKNLLTPTRNAVYSEMYQEERLLLKLILGTLKKSILDKGVVGPISNMNQLKLFGIKTKSINNYLTNKAFKGSLEYTMVDVIRANIIGRAAMIDVDRRIIIEKFECMIPKKFKFSFPKTRLQTTQY